MNVALPALIVFLLLLPGFIARSRFKRAERASIDFSPFGQVVTEAVLWACVFHFSWLIASKFLFAHELSPAILLKLLSSDAASHSAAADNVANQFYWVTFYFLTLFVGAYIIPAFFRGRIIQFRLDRFNAPFSWLFRFHQAPWYYLLTGADFDKDGQPDLISVSAIINVAGSAVLFTGILDEFFVDAEGGLDRLILQQVMRRPIAADKATDITVTDDTARFYGIDGDYFVLRYSEAITLNIEYIKLTNEAEITA